MPPLATAFVRIRPQMSTFKAETEAGATAGATSAGNKAASGFSTSFSKEINKGVPGATKSWSEQLGSQLGSQVKKLALIGAAAYAGAAVFAVKAGSELEDSQAQLRVALSHTGTSWQQQAGNIAKTGAAMEQLGYSNAVTDKALAKLTISTGSATTAQSLMGATADLAAKKGVDLASAADMVSKAAGGNARALKDLGVTMVTGATWAAALKKANSDLADQISHAGGMAQYAAVHHLTLAQAQQLTAAAAKGSIPALNTLGLEVLPATATAADRVAQLQRILNSRIGGEAAAAAKTGSGQFKVLKAELTDMAAKVGAAIIPKLISFVTWLNKSHLLIPALTIVMAGLTAALIVQAAAWAMTPMGQITLAIIAVTAAAIFLWKNWNTVWAWCKAVIVDVWDWIKGHWPLLLDILTGPVGLAVTWIVQHWRAIYDGVVSAWNDVIGFLSGLGSSILNAIGRLGDVLWNAGIQIITGLWSGMKRAWNDVFGWLGGLAGIIKSIKGPLDVDLQLLQPAGAAVMGGFGSGLKKGWKPVSQWLADINPKISASVSGAARPGAAAAAAPARQINVTVGPVQVTETADADLLARRLGFLATAGGLG